jgi:hypothetical protein
MKFQAMQRLLCYLAPSIPMMPMVVPPRTFMRIRHLKLVSTLSIITKIEQAYRLNNVFRLIQLCQIRIISFLDQRIIDLRRSLYSQLIFLIRSPYILAHRTRTLPRSKIIPNLILLGLLIAARPSISRVPAEPVYPFSILMSYSTCAIEIAFGGGKVCCCVATHCEG